MSVTMPGPSNKQPVAEQVQEKADQLADSNANSTDSDVRYMAYGARLRTALRAAQRYLAYVRCVYKSALTVGIWRMNALISCCSNRLAMSVRRSDLLSALGL